ncbi:EAL domain-containing protein [Pseudoduganella sp. GCM10020061]|uniref:EAL domain-containing protein n=1 Tax=Pseudoduganella sp. GCM10020061 TaxID=3317345 RepID=UPI0036432C39
MAPLISPGSVATILLAAGYVLFGQVALLSAAAPGYAASVWPPAGLALAGLLQLGYRAWPGVTIGSFALTFSTVYATAGTGLGAAIALGVATGATLQALLGAFLVRHLDGARTEPAGLGRIIAILVAGGPLACLAGASAGVATLWASGSIASSDIDFNWFTWWVADTIGALIVLPLYLVWKRDAVYLTRRHQVLATLPMLVLLGVITLLFRRTSELDQESVAADFNRRSELIVHNLGQKLAEYAEALHSVAGFLTVSDVKLDRSGFRRLVEDLLRRHPSLHAIWWSPYLTADERAGYERALRAEGYAPYGIRVLDAHGALVPAPAQPEYVPVTFMEPVRSNLERIGFDMASDPVRRATLQKARDSGRPATSELVYLVPPRASQRSILIIAAAYRPGEPRATVQQRQRALRGYVGAALRVELMMADFLGQIDTAGLYIRLQDPGAGPAARLLVELPPSSGPPAPRLQRLAAARASPVHQALVAVGDRRWELTVTLDENNPLPYRSPMAWSARVAALLLSGLFSTFLLVITGRNVAIEREVRQRTRELRNSNAALQESIAGLARSEHALRESEEQARSILETARDAYIAIDPAGRIVDWNREAEATFGWPRDEALGRLVLELLLPSRAGRPRSSGLVRHLASGRTRFLNRRMEAVLQKRDGTAVPVELIIWATGTGSERRFHSFVHEISSRRVALQRLAAQEAAAAALVRSATLADAAPRVLRAICTELGWSTGTIWMRDEKEGGLHCCEFWSADSANAPFEAATRALQLAPDEGLGGRVLRSGQPVWVSDIAADESFVRKREAGEAHLRSGFALPVRAGGDLLGVMEFFSRQKTEPDPGLLAMMETVGSLLGQFIARRRAEAALFEEKERAEVTLGSIGDGVIVTDIYCCVTYLNPVAETLTGWPTAQARGRPVNEVFRLVSQSGGETLPCPLGAAIHANRRVGLSMDAELVRRDGYRLMVEDAAAPVHDRAGQVVGGVMVFHDVSEARAMQVKMSHLTRHDHLTSLPNRALLYEQLSQALHHARGRDVELALLYIDLDGFKHINDALGHEAGDILLQEVTQRLLACVRTADTVSRQGGDEFTILLPEIRSSSDAIRVAEQVLEQVRAPFHIGDLELNLTASVGIALYPEDGDDPGVLLKHADAAMYRAKRSGRNQYHFFTPEISALADRRLAVETALHQALRNHELVLHFQPKVAPSTGAITGMEALVRWQRPDGVLVLPADFIEVAEDSGLITRIDQWVLEEACRQNQAWQDAGLPAVPVAVNLSAANAQIDQFPAFLAGVLERTGLQPRYLQIEMTESQMLADTQRFETLIRSINALGVKVAIDDFGTGYSSLSYLQRFPFDMLKIDQSFVKALKGDSPESAIVEAITRLAHAFGFALVAEGVETDEQARILQAYGCDEMQGFLYSRPVPAHELEALLRTAPCAPS